MKVSVDRDGSCCVVRLSGELDVSQRRDLEAAVGGAGAGSSLTVVDLADVTFIDCSVVGVLVAAATRSRRQGQSFQVANLHGISAKVIRLLDVADVLGVEEGRPGREADVGLSRRAV